MKPSSGIKFLFEHNLVAKEPKAVAQFLRDSPGLDKVMISWQLGVCNTQDRRCPGYHGCCCKGYVGQITAWMGMGCNLRAARGDLDVGVQFASSGVGDDGSGGMVVGPVKAKNVGRIAG
uniref:SEC7 domain-containing protein n=1 Tax=Physcomitrium patens TaxID=3218 RepID=A0A7I3Z1S7_PHYPA